MSRMYKRLESCVKAIREKTDFVPETALVLGSGLGGFAQKVKVEAQVPYGDIPGFPVSTVAGHEGKFIFGTVEDAPVVVMQGRVHFYEGYSMEDVIAPIRIMGMLGAKRLILTNAAGGINTKFSPGDLMVLEDHISVLVPNPLVGENVEELGTRFPDMTQVYDPVLNKAIFRSAEKVGVTLQHGVYIQCSGPSYETPAEIRVFRNMGADAVGMSTVCEAIAARHMGLQVCGISCITNLAGGMQSQPLSHEEVQQVADRVKDRFGALVYQILSDFHQLSPEGEQG